MKLLLDQGLPWSCATILREAGFDAVHAGEISLATAEDEFILERGRNEGRIVVTLDADFHALMALSGATSPSVIRLRIEGLKAEKDWPNSCNLFSGNAPKTWKQERWLQFPPAPKG